MLSYNTHLYLTYRAEMIPQITPKLNLNAQKLFCFHLKTRMAVTPPRTITTDAQLDKCERRCVIKIKEMGRKIKEKIQAQKKFRIISSHQLW